MTDPASPAPAPAVENPAPTALTNWGAFARLGVAVALGASVFVLAVLGKVSVDVYIAQVVAPGLALVFGAHAISTVINSNK